MARNQKSLQHNYKIIKILIEQCLYNFGIAVYYCKSFTITTNQNTLPFLDPNKKSWSTQWLESYLKDVYFEDIFF